MKSFLVSGLAIALLLGTMSVLAQEKEEPKFKAVCPVSGKAAIETSSVDYRGGKVYFCCTNCPKAFAADTAKFATKANHQLVATKQAKQVKCPLTGRDLAADKTVKINEVTVTFCCPNCQGKVAKAAAAEQLTLVFSDTAFAKGFEVPKKEQ
jgi:YHS domain-containing protein